jgi:hypothetical protein
MPVSKLTNSRFSRTPVIVHASSGVLRDEKPIGKPSNL